MSTLRLAPILLLLLAVTAAWSPADTPANVKPRVVWVDSHWTGPKNCGGHKWGIDAFAAIQPAVNASVKGGTVSVVGGTYPGKIVIDRHVSLRGPYADLDVAPIAGLGHSGRFSGPPPAIVIPAATDLTVPGGTLIEVTSDNVTINGFTVDGHNPALTDGTPVNDTTASAAIGIGYDGRNIQRTVIEDNNIRNFTQAGIWCKTLGKWSEHNQITDNRIDNMPLRKDSLPYLTPNALTACGIRIAQEWHGVVEGNTITRTAVGIHSSNFTSPLGEVDGYEPSPVIRHNSIQAYYDGIIVNLVFDHFYSGPYLILSGNDIEMIADSTAGLPDRYGLCLLGVHGSSRVVAIGNRISGWDDGVYAWNNGPRTVNPAIEIDRGTISDCKIGVLATNTSPFGNSETDSTVFVHGTFIRECATAVSVNDDAKATHSVALLISDGTRIFGGKTGILLRGGRASLQLMPAWCSVQLTGQSGDYITLAGNGDTYPGDVSIASAVFGGGEDYHQGKRVANMTPYELKAVQAKITDKLSDPKLGRVQ